MGLSTFFFSFLFFLFPFVRNFQGKEGGDRATIPRAPPVQYLDTLSFFANALKRWNQNLQIFIYFFRCPVVVTFERQSVELSILACDKIKPEEICWSTFFRFSSIFVVDWSPCPDKPQPKKRDLLWPSWNLCSWNATRSPTTRWSRRGGWRTSAKRPRTPASRPSSCSTIRWPRLTRFATVKQVFFWS